VLGMVAAKALAHYLRGTPMTSDAFDALPIVAVTAFIVTIGYYRAKGERQ